jgi:hypothetical protein
VLLVVEPGGTSLWKCDAAGTPQWRNVYPAGTGGTSSDIAPCANGDVLLAYATIHASWDTLIPAFELWRIDPNGAVLWHEHYVQDTLFGSIMYYGLEVSVVENDQAELLVLTNLAGSGNERVAVTKVDGSGALIWSRQVGDPLSGMAFPCTLNSCLGELSLYPDAQGGCRLTMASADHSESALILCLAPDGSLAWARQFDYLGLVNTFEMFPHVATADGTTVLITLSTSLNGGLHLIHISATGTLLKVDRYELSSNCCTGLAYDQGALIVRFYDGLFTLNEEGAIASGSQLIPFPADTDFTYTMGSNTFNVHDGRAFFSGTFTSTPIGAGLPMVSPAFTSFGIEDGTVCGRASFTAAHDVLPNALFTCEPILSLGTDDHALQVASGSLTSVPRPLLASIDLCTLTAIAPVAENRSAFAVDRTLLLAGEPLTVTADRPLRYSVVDIKGATVWSGPRSGLRSTIPTGDLTSGLYMLVGRDVAGEVVGTAKVVVE